MHAQLVKIRYGALELRDKIRTADATHQAEIARLNNVHVQVMQMQQAQQVHTIEGMRRHAIAQETRIMELMAEKLAWEHERAQFRKDVRAFKEVVKEKENKIWKYTRQLGNKAADLEMVRADRDANREMVKELKNKVDRLERESDATAST